MTDTAVAPAWYPDPSGQADFRWWDGATWTAHTRSSAPVPEHAPAPAHPATPTAAVAAPASAPATVSESTESPGGPFFTPEERAAIYAARAEKEAAPPVKTGPEAWNNTDAWRQPIGIPGPTPLGADPLRTQFQEEQYRNWRKNTAATTALVLAGINLAVFIFAMVQHISPYYRIVPSIFGVVASLVALRQATRTETGLLKSLIALVINVIVGVIAGIAVVQLLGGLASGGNPVDLIRGDDYSQQVEERIIERGERDQGVEITTVDCPADMQRRGGKMYTCTEVTIDGDFHSVSVLVQDSSGSFEYSIE